VEFGVSTLFTSTSPENEAFPLLILRYIVNNVLQNLELNTNHICVD
jgi:hypothetical protein